MPEGVFDRLARDLDASSGRRSSLKVLGMAAFAAALAPAAAEGKSKCKKKVDSAVAQCQADAQAASDARCQKQVADCTTVLATLCEGDECGPLVACCQSLATCDATAFFTCVRDATDEQRGGNNEQVR